MYNVRIVKFKNYLVEENTSMFFWKIGQDHSTFLWAAAV